MWIDTHCHLDAPEFAPDRAAVWSRAQAAGVSRLVLPAVATAHFPQALALSRELGVHVALGIHPLWTPQHGDEALAVLRDALVANCDNPRLVAVGEIGLDHFVPGLDHERQQFFYVEQLKLAREFELPVLLHVRRSADALLRELRRIRVPGGVAHAFNGSVQQAQAFIDLGFKLGFGGTLTFDRALQIRRLAAELPLSALVLETDAPDIPPHWLYATAAERAAGAATGRNEPAELPRIAAELAALRGMTLADLAAASSANAEAVLPGLRRAVVAAA